ncbi:MAG: hypothetical protein AB1560_07240 [Pseudomonadota bacterium]
MRWKTLGALAVGAATVLGVAIAVTNFAINYYRDQPRLYVSIIAYPPEYRFSTNDKWSADIKTTPFEEFIDLMYLSMGSSFLEKNKLLTPRASEFIKRKGEQAESLIDNLQVRIPIRVSIANNGRQPATIVSGRLIVYGYKNNKSISRQLDNVREFIAPSSVIDLNVSNVEFDKRRSIPDIIMWKLMVDAMTKKMASWGSGDNKSGNLIPKIFRGLSQIMDVPIWEETPLKIEVELTDQFGTVIKDSTVLREKISADTEKIN